MTSNVFVKNAKESQYLFDNSIGARSRFCRTSNDINKTEIKTSKAFKKLQELAPDAFFLGGDIVHSKTQGISPELIEILRQSGMNTSSATGPGGNVTINIQISF